MVEVQATAVALHVRDDAVQRIRGTGVSQDFALAEGWASQSTLRFADSPDEVRLRVVARAELGRHNRQALVGTPR